MSLLAVCSPVVCPLALGMYQARGSKGTCRHLSQHPERPAHLLDSQQVTSPAKRTCWQAPNARRGRAFVRSLSRTDSSAPGRQEELTDVLVRLGSDDVGAAVSDAFLQVRRSPGHAAACIRACTCARLVLYACHS